jgi:hypothetical protein
VLPADDAAEAPPLNPAPELELPVLSTYLLVPVVHTMPPDPQATNATHRFPVDVLLTDIDPEETPLPPPLAKPGASVPSPPEPVTLNDAPVSSLMLIPEHETDTV